MKRRILTALTLLISTPLLAIEAEAPIFKQYTMKQGLPANKATCLCQDSSGFIWIGTLSGICRFDGYDFKNYAAELKQLLETDDYQLNILSIAEDHDNGIWFGTETHLFRYDTREETLKLVTQAKSSAKDIVTDKNGRIYIAAGYNGILVFGSDTNPIDTCKLGSSSFVNTICLSDDGSILAGTARGLYHVSKEGEAVKSEIFSDKNISKIICDSQGNYWIGSRQNGVAKLNHSHDMRKNKATYYLNDQPRAQHLHDIKEYLPGIILVTSDSGLHVIDCKNGTTKEFVPTSNPGSLRDIFLYGLLVDRDKGVWIGTYSQGVNYHSRIFNRITRIKNTEGGQITGHFCEDEHRNLWISSDDGGISRYNTEHGVFENFSTNDESGLSFYNTHALMLQDQYLWIGTYTKGIDLFDIATKKVVHHYNMPESNSIYTLLTDLNGDIWAGTLNGCSILYKNSDNFVRIGEDVIPRGSRILDIKQDHTGMIWVASCDHGLYSYTPRNKQWKSYVEHTGKRINTLGCTQKELYIGTRDKGLLRYDLAAKRFNPLFHLENQQIKTIIPLNTGHIWFTTDSGMFMYDTARMQCIQYNNNGNFNRAFVNYSANSGILTSDGMICFGGSHGIDCISTSEAFFDDKPIEITFTGLNIFYNSVSARTPESPLEKSISFSDRIVLRHNQSTFSLTLSTLNYATPRKIRYAYRLDKYDSRWIYPNDNQIHYTKLPAGTYELLIKATNSDGIWSSDVKQLEIVIKPHVLGSTGAKSCYLLLALTLFFQAARLLKKKQQEKNRKLISGINEKNELEVYNTKMEFYTNIAHEIKTPLSLITGPINSIINNYELPKEVTNELLIVEKNSDRLFELIQELLDFRKVETRSYDLRAENCHPVSIIEDLMTQFKYLIESKRVTARLTFSEDAKNFVCTSDTAAASKIFGNIINNAIKYTNDRVAIDCRLEEGMCSITVSDNGSGIGSDDLPHIFKPFYRSKSQSKRISGTGLGLALTKSLCDLLNWQIVFESDTDTGSRVTVNIPDFGRDNEQIAAPEETELNIINHELFTVLLVENNPELLDFLSRQVRTKYNTIEANSAEKALQIMSGARVDIIVSDLLMPGMDGIEFCKRVKDNLATSHIPVIILTASTNIDNKLKSFRSGADAYIEKPIKPVLLLAQINSILSNRKRNIEIFTKSDAGCDKITGANSKDANFLNALNEYIYENLSNPDLDIENLCEKFLLGRTTMFNKLKSLCGATPKEYVKIIRLKRAAGLLINGEYRINEVGYLVGFNTPSYFTKCFIKHFGLSPRDYLIKHNTTKS